MSTNNDNLLWVFFNSFFSLTTQLKFPRPACKPHSVHAGFPAPMSISLECELPHTSCSLPVVVDLAIQVTYSHSTAKNDVSY